MERVSKVLEAEPGLSIRKVREAVAGKAVYIDRALDVLIREAWIEMRPEAPRSAITCSVRIARTRTLTVSPTVSRPCPESLWVTLRVTVSRAHLLPMVAQAIRTIHTRPLLPSEGGFVTDDPLIDRELLTDHELSSCDRSRPDAARVRRHAPGRRGLRGTGRLRPAQAGRGGRARLLRLCSASSASSATR
jgi:hypothetical protein